MKSPNRGALPLAAVIALLFVLPSQTQADPLVVAPPNTIDGSTYLLIDNVVGGNPPDYIEAITGTNGFDTNGGGNHWGETRRWSNGNDTTATWSFDGLAEDTYLVFASWRNSAQGNLGTAEYIISDGGPTLALDQIPGTTSYGGSVTLTDVASNNRPVDFAPLGAATVTDGTLEVTATKAGGDFVFFDAIAITPEPDPIIVVAPPNTSDGNTYLLIDNVVGGDPPEYVEDITGTNGFDTNGGGNHWGTTRRWSNGDDTTATWAFDGLADGTYEVFASWRNSAQGNLGTAEYTISDGGPTLSLNQIPGTSSYDGAVTLTDVSSNDRPVDFARLGSVTITDGTLEISATKAGGNFVFFDAIAITQTSPGVIPEPTSLAILGLFLPGVACLRRRRN